MRHTRISENGFAYSFSMLAATFGLLVVTLLATTATAGGPRVYAEGELPADRRLGELNNLDGYFPMTVPASADAWEARANTLRRQLQVGLGLWPMPTATPTGAVIHGKVDRDDYTVEKVFFESFPGHFVTGSLYRPKAGDGPRPGVLCPHGHWSQGRFYDAGRDAIRQQLVEGAERFEVGGRHPIQARCIQLARMGCVVFQYDMVGYADSGQLSHRPGIREEMNTATDWGYFSPQAELRLEHMMGLQTYNSIRALDWFSELSDVDPGRIAVTGASGGGTQTFVLCALDPRPVVAFPAVMVSTAMQGGCTCENCSYLRVGTGNIEIAALIAPRPLGMTGALDWTRDIMTKGLPELNQLYAMLGRPDDVRAEAFLQFGHNYNNVSRAVMYSWLNKHLGLGFEDPIVEQPFEPLSIAEMSVWDDAHPRPPAGDDYERSLVRWITEDNEQQIAALTSSDAESLAQYREVVGSAFAAILGRGLPDAAGIEYILTHKVERAFGLEFAAKLEIASEGEEVPVAFLLPRTWNTEAVIWLSYSGKAGLFNDDGTPIAPVAELVSKGYAVAGLDMLYQGEYLADGQPLTKARRVNDDYIGYTYGYNYPLFAERVQDVLTLVSYIRNHEDKPSKVHLVGLGGSGILAAAARARAGDAIDRAVIDTAGYRFAGITSLDDLNFLPGSVKYGDVPALLALGAPRETWIAGEGESLPELVTATYIAAGAGDALVSFTGSDEEKTAAALEWLTR
jgi:dienelactone hydrolase